MTTMASSGVKKTPRMFDSEAETIAPATLPPAIEVKLMELCTVDGRIDSHSTPRYSSGPR